MNVEKARMNSVENGTEDPLVYARSVGSVLRVTINRPQALNALKEDMIRSLSEALQLATAEPNCSVFWLDGAGERAFCGGGDVKEMASGSLADQLAFLGDEYRLDLALATAVIPVVAVMSGITMGGGIGLGGHARYRIVTETSKLGMPEVRIGIAPDVGGSLLLAQAPGRLGELLAMTAGVMTAGDAIALGFADFFVHEADIPALRQAVSDGAPVAEALEVFAAQPPSSSLLASRAWCDRLADEALGSAEQVLEAPASAARRFVTAMEKSPHREARDAAKLARQMSPVSVAVSLAQLSRVRLLQQNLAEVLADDYRLLGRLLQRDDFAEGVRALLIDRDGAPKWFPAHLDQVHDDEVQRLCDPVLRAGEQEWTR